MHRRAYGVLTNWRPWMGLATLLFSVWYAVFLFRYAVVDSLAALAGVAHAQLPAVPLVRVESLRTVVGVVTAAGIPASVVTFVVGFVLFHRQSDTS